MQILSQVCRFCRLVLLDCDDDIDVWALELEGHAGLVSHSDDCFSRSLELSTGF